MFRLGARRASLRDDIHELGKIAWWRATIPATTRPLIFEAVPGHHAPLPSIHPQHRRFDCVTIAARCVKTLEKDRAQRRR
jgi:hypothetical protein